MPVKSYFDPDTSSFTHLVWDDSCRQAAIIDPVLNFNYRSARTSNQAADLVIDDIKRLDLQLQYILETHAHADHLSAAAHIKQRCGGQTAIGANMPLVQREFKNVFNLAYLASDGSQFDLLLHEGQRLALGELSIEVLETPGHTPACVSYKIGAAIFIGDTFFAPSYGTARADFPGGDATALYQSLQRLLSFPDATPLYLCHDYPKPGEEPHAVYTVAEQRKNIHLQGKGADDFIQLRRQRDAQLDMPALILPAIQVNIGASELPRAEGNGTAYLKIPLNQIGK
ncbi:MBL fold metallo-hydrolase [Gammaproteobacteria bacterium 53_120_T64]|nr:MBL fold metallo-hydrolase [Gammaproteobacteria bacterium 53_120_T64]